MSDNPIAEKSYSFALHLVEFYKQSIEGQYDKPLSKQLLHDAHYMSEETFLFLQPAIKEIIKILTSIVKHTKN